MKQLLIREDFRIIVITLMLVSAVLFNLIRIYLDFSISFHIKSFARDNKIYQTIEQLLSHRYREKHQFWETVSQLKIGDIDLILDILFPTFSENPEQFERSLLFDKEMFLTKKQEKYTDIHNDWPDSSYTWEPPENQKVGNSIMKGIRDIQHLIFKHQNPPSLDKCTEKKFLILNGKRTGLSSQFHVTGIGLAKALDMDRIAIWDQGTSFIWNRGYYCDGYSNKRGYDCFFEPLSNCTLGNFINSSVFNAPTMNSNNNQNSQFLFVDDYVKNNAYIPKIVVPIFEKLMIPKSIWYFYWRLCTSAYIVRYNNRTKDWINSFEKEYLSNPGKVYDVSIHVRHAEKGNEMILIDVPRYYSACKVIEKLLKKNNLNVFISSEDPMAVSWFQKNTNYTISYFNYTLHNENFEAIIPMGVNLTRRLLSNLKHSIFSKYVIGTLGSNWNRLINEMRMTTAGKANELYFEVGDHTCLSVEHCKYTKQEFHMNW